MPRQRGDPEPAHLLGHGPVPAGWARDLVRRATADAEVWLRRLWTLPDAASLVAMDSRSRRAPEGLAALVATRDLGTCRTPWCGAPIRTTDHAVEHHSGGPTSAANLQGLCERCNPWIEEARNEPSRNLASRHPAGRPAPPRARATA